MTDDKLRLRIAQDLTAIVTMYDHLADEAAHRAHQSSEEVLPGGDALNMLGPAANLEAWDNRYATAEQRGMTTATDYAYDQVDHEDHPLLVLASWEDIVRDQRNQPADLRATVHRAASYLRDSIDWMLSEDDYGNARFLPLDALMVDLRRVRSRLEAVLHDGVRHERTGVECIAEDCPAPSRLIKLYGAQVRWDSYRCPVCRTPYDQAQFLQAKAQNLRREGTDRFVLVTQAIEATEVPKPTIHSWIRRGLVRSVCSIKDRRLMVWWPDIREHAEEWRRRRSA